MFSKIFPKLHQPKKCILQTGRRFLPTLCSDTIALRQHKTPLKDRIQPIPVPLYGGRHMVTMLPGVGVGPELMTYVRDIFSYVGVPVDFEVITIDPRASRANELENIILSIKRNRVALKANLGSDMQDTDQSDVNVIIRSRLDLYVNVLHCKSYPNVPAKHQNADIVLIRQNTEGEYAMLEHENQKGIVESLKIITEKNSRRLSKWAFKFAKENGRKKITVVHKANILTLSDGLFLRTVQDVGKSYPDIEVDDILIDNCCMQLVKDPHQFDILIMPNLYGMILSNIVCGMLGGPGLHPGQNFGDNYGVFETGIRTAGLKLAGKGIANPTAIINASAALLRYLGHQNYGNMLREAVHRTLCDDGYHTPDLGGVHTSEEVVYKIKDNLSDLLRDKSSFEMAQEVVAA